MNCPSGVADRVNLGLIPTAEMSYEAACKALKADKGGMLHIHANVKRSDDGDTQIHTPNDQMIVKDGGFACKYKEWEDWALETAAKIKEFWDQNRAKDKTEGKITLMLMTKVKSYAPKVEHLVLDLKCT